MPEALGDPKVHAGFRAALDSVAQRLKQLLLVATRHEPYDLELTGHSLGGALATLFAFDVAAGLDADRALPVRPRVGRSWYDPRSLCGGMTRSCPAPATRRTRMTRRRNHSGTHVIGDKVLIDTLHDEDPPQCPPCHLPPLHSLLLSHLDFLSLVLLRLSCFLVVTCRPLRCIFAALSSLSL